MTTNTQLNTPQQYATESKAKVQIKRYRQASPTIQFLAHVIVYNVAFLFLALSVWLLVNRLVYINQSSVNWFNLIP